MVEKILGWLDHIGVCAVSAFGISMRAAPSQARV